MRIQGTVKGLAISPSGKLLYAITSRPSTKGANAHVLTIIDTETRKVRASRTLTISGAEVATFDIEAGATSIFISSTQPFVIGTRKGGVVRVPVRKHRVGRPQFFALANIGAGAIAYNEPSRTLGILVPRDQSAKFRKTPRS